MREIKFRVWFEDLKLMVYNGFDEERDCLNKTLKRFNKKQNLMQYTGLKDKNGVEIYEGDLIPLGYSMSVVVYNDYIFDNPCFCLKVLNEDELFEPFKHKDDIPNWIEVIGNIYENKELLNDYS